MPASAEDLTSCWNSQCTCLELLQYLYVRQKGESTVNFPVPIGEHLQQSLLTQTVLLCRDVFTALHTAGALKSSFRGQMTLWKRGSRLASVHAIERLQLRHDSKSAVNISAFSRLSPLSSVSVWQKSDWLYSELRNERSLELKFFIMSTVAIAQLSRCVDPVNIAQRLQVRCRLPFSYH